MNSVYELIYIITTFYFIFSRPFTRSERKQHLFAHLLTGINEQSLRQQIKGSKQQKVSEQCEIMCLVSELEGKIKSDFAHSLSLVVLLSSSVSIIQLAQFVQLVWLLNLWMLLLASLWQLLSFLKTNICISYHIIKRKWYLQVSWMNKYVFE